MYNIGFKNPSKFAKYEIWRRFGFCPTNLSYVQITQILNNQLDPNVFYTDRARSLVDQGTPLRF